MKDTLSFYWNVLKNGVNHFLDNDMFTNAAALSYYTIFSLPPILLVTIYTATAFFSRGEIENAIYGQISDMVGQNSADQLNSIISNLGVFEGGSFATVVSVIALFFTASTVLVTMQNALNKIFEVKVVAEGWQGIIKLVRDRILSFGFIIGFAFIMMVSLVIHALIGAFSDMVEVWLGPTSTVFTLIASEAFTIAIITVLFAAIFKWLPDVQIKWKDTWFGAFITALLFTVGKFGISFYIGKSETATMYDAAGGIIVLMVWVFWASIIFFFGASFTYSRVSTDGRALPSVEYAVKVKEERIELE